MAVLCGSFSALANGVMDGKKREKSWNTAKTYALVGVTMDVHDLAFVTSKMITSPGSAAAAFSSS